MSKVLKGSLSTEVTIEDEPGFGNANHKYYIRNIESGNLIGELYFQSGPINEVGINGVTNEDLLEIVTHRLECFQSSQFSCRENALARTKIQEAIHWLAHRTAERQARGVEGTHQK